MSRDILMAKFEEKSSSVSCVSEIDAFKKMYLGPYVLYYSLKKAINHS